MAGSASGHGGEVGLEVIPSRAAGGDAVFIYGEELEPGSQVEVTLHAADGPRLIGVFDVDEDGHVIERATIPPDLPPRVYELQLAAPAGETVSAYLTVVAGGRVDPPSGDDPASAMAVPLVGGLLLVGVLGMVAGWIVVSRSMRRPR